MLRLGKDAVRSISVERGVLLDQRGVGSGSFCTSTVSLTAIDGIDI